MDTEINRDLDDLPNDLQPDELEEIERLERQACELSALFNPGLVESIREVRQEMEEFIRQDIPARYPNPTDTAREVRAEYEEYKQFCRDLIEIAQEKQRAAAAQRQHQHQNPFDLDQMGIEDVVFNTPRYGSFGG